MYFYGFGTFGYVKRFVNFFLILFDHNNLIRINLKRNGIRAGNLLSRESKGLLHGNSKLGERSFLSDVRHTKT